MKIVLFALPLFFVLFLFFSSGAFAQYKKDVSKFYISGNIGGGTLYDSDDSDSGFSYGAEIAVRPYSRIDAGLCFSDLRLLSGNLEYHNYFYMVFGNFHVKEPRNGFFFGPQFGLARHAINGLGLDYYIDTFGGGFRAGYEYPINEDLSLNVDLRFLWTESGKKVVFVDNTEIEVSVDNANFIQYFLSLKYYF